jgi:spore coat protein A
MWGYNGLWPGPTFDTRRGEAVSVHWKNELPTEHFLPIDTSIHGAGESTPQVRTVTHLHGGRVLPESDGYPEAWSTSDGKMGPAHAADPFRYPNAQPASTLWYHDHALGITRLNVYAGLAGFYIIRDEEEDALNLPRGKFEIPLLIQDRLFDPDGSLLYPVAQNGAKPIWIKEFFGDTICVNGKAAPFLAVEPRKYRFRILNGSNSRFYRLTLVPADADGKRTGNAATGPPFIQIGTDSGLLPAPVRLPNLIISPGERFDVVVDFSGHERGSLALVNDALAPYMRGGQIVPSDVMLFKVTKALTGRDKSSVAATLAPWEPLDATDGVRERFLSLTEMERPAKGHSMMGLLGQKHWSEPITEDPRAGTTEIWSFANATDDVHPMHTHLVRFQVLNRQSFDVKFFQKNGTLVFTGRPVPPESNERPAWKDTVKTYPGMVTRVIQKFDLPVDTKVLSGQEFRYVWHCHILEHEDNEMMRPYNIVG